MQTTDHWRYPAAAALSLFVAAGFASLRAQAQTDQTPPGPASCHAVQLEPFTEQGDCAMGRCYRPLELRNVSSTACTLPAHTSVTAQYPKGVTKALDVSAEKPLVLQPGQFGEYVSESYNPGVVADPPPAILEYEFRFAPDDPGEIDFSPGDQGIASGPQPVFDSSHPAPDLSSVPHQVAGDFVLSAFFWPPLKTNAHTTIDPNRQNSLGDLHISLTNHGSINSAEWRYCRFTIDARGDGSLNHQVSEAPCAWQGGAAHGVIVVGATASLGAEVLLPKDCHPSRYTVTVNLEKGPVKMAPITLHTGEVQCGAPAP